MIKEASSHDHQHLAPTAGDNAEGRAWGSEGAAPELGDVAPCCLTFL